MRPLTKHQCKFPKLARHRPEDEVTKAVATILNDQTHRYEVDNMAAACMMEDDTPLPNDHSFQWPLQRPTYLEYSQPLLADPTDEDPHPTAEFSGIVILPENDHSTMIIVGADAERAFSYEHRLDHRTGTLLNEPHAEEAAVAERYYFRLARHMHRYLTNANNPRRPRPGQRFAAYAAENVPPGQRRPELEEIIRQASSPSRTFDAVVVYSRWVLGTEREQDDAIARLSEHGVPVIFVDEQPPVE